MYLYKNEFYNGKVAGKVFIRENADGTLSSFGEWVDNTDYQEYLAWLELGNEPLPADQPEGN
jgi:hypothetical protein